ncbi:YlxR family protein [Saccharomonospora piscinae]|uniref:YlxR family protein n=1 Tax=Saccharomonospora piscinae TaxID=687388 RepID=UPI0004B91DFD|nr:YlxR family protein [Saccharomonospora piscinae]
MVASAGHAVVDERRRLPGRGAWVHPDPGCVSRAERRRAFPRALRARAALDTTGVWQHVERLTESRTDTEPPRPDRNKEAGRPVMSQP